MSCVSENTKKYVKRPSPPFPANKCKNMTKKGNNGTFIAKFSVDRSDYQIGKKNSGVAETLKITANIPVTKK